MLVVCLMVFILACPLICLIFMTVNEVQQQNLYGQMDAAVRKKSAAAGTGSSRTGSKTIGNTGCSCQGNTAVISKQA